jgi:hypothetical protein
MPVLHAPAPFRKKAASYAIESNKSGIYRKGKADLYRKYNEGRRIAEGVPGKAPDVTNRFTAASKKQEIPVSDLFTAGSVFGNESF